MGGEADAVDEIAFLARSGTRVRVLDHLRTAGPSTRRDLSRELDVSRSTVSRSLSALEERNWIRDGRGTYELTGLGTVIAEEFAGLVETVCLIERLSPFLRWFPQQDYDLPLEALAEASITRGTASDPHAPTREHHDMLTATPTGRCLVTSMDLGCMQTINDRVCEGALQVELVASPSVAATLETGEFAPLVREATETGDMTVRVATGPLPFYLGLGGETRVQIGVEDDDGFPRALVETTNPTVRAWAETVYRDHRRAAREKPSAQF